VDIARADMEKNPDLTSEQMDMGINFTRKFFLPLAIAAALFGTAIWGAIASLIGAALAKKNPSTPFENAG